MAKSKKKSKKNQSFSKIIKPFIKDKRILLSILGAGAVGVALVSALGNEKIAKTLGIDTDSKKEQSKTDKKSQSTGQVDGA